MNYKELVKEYTELLDERTEKLAINAIKRLRGQEYRRSWQWIYTALNLKEHDIWEVHGMGLLFLESYNRQVMYELQHEENLKSIEEKAKTIDVEAFWANEMSKSGDDE